ncbi:MAG: hypothetical protein ABIL58_11160 [Pseudomonadota bacterium]
MENQDKKYQILFTGELLPGQDCDIVKQNIRDRFKNGDRLIRLISDGRASVLKKNADYKTACQLKSIGETCGIVLVIQPMGQRGAGQPEKSDAPSQEKALAPGEMITCPWCGFWQLSSQNCAQCGKQLSGAPSRKKASVDHKTIPPVSNQTPKKSFAAKFENLRIAILLCILLLVGLATWMNQKSIASWKRSLHVVIYPINGDGSHEISNFIASLVEDDFNVVEEFFSEEAESYGVPLSVPLVVSLASEVKDQPPPPPIARSRFSIMWWSLRLRYWVFASDHYKGPTPDIRAYIVYHDAIKNRVLEDSLGIEKSRTGIVHAFADLKMADQNKVVLAHELLHTLGATDKYDMRTLKPDFPDGFADPDRTPLYPQTHAEIMASRIPESDNRWEMPRSLDFVVIGRKTAQEIKWLK